MDSTRTTLLSFASANAKAGVDRTSAIGGDTSVSVQRQPARFQSQRRGYACLRPLLLSPKQVTGLQKFRAIVSCSKLDHNGRRHESTWGMSDQRAWAAS